MDHCRRLFQAFGRRKTIDQKKLLISRFRRNLNIFDLLGIGVGSCLGIGVYVIITYVIKHQAGPSAVVSVLIAGVAAFLSGLCYAEFAIRLPQAGSSYVYIYASLGELSAFVVGWSMLLEYILLAAVTAKAWSQYFDGLLNGTINSYFNKTLYLPGDENFTNAPDFVSCGILLLIGALFLCSSKMYTTLSFLLTILNSLVIFCIICVGFFHVKHENWTNPPGYFPFGLTGVIAGASTLFCIFSSIDIICSTTEETKEPVKMIPSAITTTNVLSCILLVCVTAALTLSYPWYKFTDTAAIPKSFQSKGVNGSFYVFSIGGLLGLTTALINSLHGVTRIMFAMKTDRLLYPCCLPKLDAGQNLITLAFIPLLLSSVFSLFCTLNMLIQFLALGTLIAHSCVAICVINVRYQAANLGLIKEYEDIIDDQQSTEFLYAPFMAYNNNICKEMISEKNTKQTILERISHDQKCQFSITKKPRDSTYQKMDSIVNATPVGSTNSLIELPMGVSTEPTYSTSMTASVSLIIFIVASTVFSFVVVFANNALIDGSWWACACFLISVIILVVSTVAIVKQPNNQSKLLFKTPYVPFVPLLSIFMNMMLMSALSYKAWLRFSMWLFVGLVVYFVYGIRKSTEIDIDDQEVVLYEINEQEKCSLKGNAK